MRLTFHDMHDTVCRVQAELSGADASIPLSAVEALGTRAGAVGKNKDDLSVEAGIAAGLARSALDRSVGHISITSEAYLRRLSQVLAALSHTPSWQK
ncbi:MAG TPA: hypothetical protein VHD38_00500 [Candidatus Paceibacterota bacterium]|nr:hypothetical protein [Candidatus Paceibacterota bacterium]